MKQIPIMTTDTQDNGKTAAIVSYLTIIGWLIAYFAMYRERKTPLAGYHLRQTLLLFIVGIILNIITRFLPTTSAMFYVVGGISLVLFIFWIIGFVGAIQGKESPMPIIGGMAQSTFSSL